MKPKSGARAKTMSTLTARRGDVLAAAIRWKTRVDADVRALNTTPGYAALPAPLTYRDQLRDDEARLYEAVARLTRSARRVAKARARSRADEGESHAGAA